MNAGRRRPRLRFLTHEFDAIVEPLGHRSDEAKGEFIGINPTTLGRIRKGESLPGNTFIAAVRLALPAVPLERLFRVER